VATRAVSEKPYELAYEASIRAIENQAAIVESLRSRAGTILAATALVTSFFGGHALSRSGGYRVPAWRSRILAGGSRRRKAMKRDVSDTPLPRPRWPDMSKPDSYGGSRASPRPDPLWVRLGRRIRGLLRSY
jgi:hypothetical protein